MVRLPYKNFPQSGLCAVLGVYIALPVRNSVRSKKIEAVIDSGATHCVFHAEVGKSVGFDIEKGKQEKTLGVDGKASAIWFHDMHIYLPGGIITSSGSLQLRLATRGPLGDGRVLRTLSRHF